MSLTLKIEIPDRLLWLFLQLLHPGFIGADDLCSKAPEDDAT